MIEVHPTFGGPQGGLGPHFRIQNGKMYREYGHPEGKGYQPCCEKDGEYFYKKLLNEDLFVESWPNPIFIQRGKYLYTGSGHPDGEGHMYYELRKIRATKPEESDQTSNYTSSYSSESYTGGSIIPFGYKVIGVFSLGFTAMASYMHWIPGQPPIPIPKGMELTGEMFIMFWGTTLFVLFTTFAVLSFLYRLITKD